MSETHIKFVPAAKECIDAVFAAVLKMLDDETGLSRVQRIHAMANMTGAMLTQMHLYVNEEGIDQLVQISKDEYQATIKKFEGMDVH